MMAIGNIEEFITPIDYDQFVSNKQTIYATTYNIQIIGEAVYMLSKTFKDSHPEVNWTIIEKMRHVLVHGYYKMSPQVVWNVATEDIPFIKPQIQHLLRECTGQDQHRQA